MRWCCIPQRSRAARPPTGRGKDHTRTDGRDECVWVGGEHSAATSHTLSSVCSSWTSTSLHILCILLEPWGYRLNASSSCNTLDEWNPCLFCNLKHTHRAYLSCKWNGGITTEKKLQHHVWEENHICLWHSSRFWNINTHHHLVVTWSNYLCWNGALLLKYKLRCSSSPGEFQFSLQTYQRQILSYFIPYLLFCYCPVNNTCLQMSWFWITVINWRTL